tara:strand:+ start:1249 stop:1788 length:540 start_codon:yes stop_codon:yes gene_type:complete
MKIIISVIFLSLLLIVMSCNQISDAYYNCSSKDLEYETISITLINDSNSIPINLYHAKSDLERKKGLMCVRDFKNIDGMLFSYQKEQSSGFWMYKTFIPLTIIYFDSNNLSIDFFEMNPCKRDLFENVTNYKQKCYEESKKYTPPTKYLDSLEIIETFEKLEEIKTILEDDKLKLMINN